ncbi:MAG: DUF2244 domain-containing protein [Comamonadaceae bacterium]|nr:MAG: DUF2244 domain-containing protein [Comamonadaceae bacterium]
MPPDTARPRRPVSARAWAVPTMAWRLRRPCALAPHTFFSNIGALGLVLGAVGAGFWIAGYPLVTFFCACQAVAIGAAALVYAVHALDGERIAVEGGRVRIECTRGREESVVELPVEWVRLEQSAAGAVVLRSGRTQVAVGRQLTEAQRRLFAAEFAASLASARGAAVAPRRPDCFRG